MATGGLDALADGYYYRQTFMVYFAAEQFLHLPYVLGQGIDGVHMVGIGSQTEAYLAQFSSALTILAAGHAGGEIVGNDNGYRTVFVDGVEQTCHSAVCECGVAYDGHRRVLAGVGGTLCHGD